MHRGVRDKLEDILAGRRPRDRHLDECAECKDEVAAMLEQHRLLQSLRPPDEVEPRAGFYARVIERIESQGALSIWSLFFESAAGRGLAMASMVLALSLGVYLVSSERDAALPAAAGQVMAIPDFGAGAMLTGSPDRDAVLVNLVTYREQ